MTIEIEMTGEATYCPEDNKLRLYVGRVPREEYLSLKSAGFKSTPKQDCDFVATWTPGREDIAIAYGDGYIEDEDQSPADRAADRAERFIGYRDKRTGEALQLADNYDERPQIHGYQSSALAERKAKAHDRIATRAVTQWDKAEYWQRRTSGVISHALHVSSPGVRMGRIKTLEKELRGKEKDAEQYAITYKLWKGVLLKDDPEEAFKSAYHIANTVSWGYCYRHPRPDTCTSYHSENDSSLYSLLTDEKDPITGHEAAQLWLDSAVDPDNESTYSKRWTRHLKLRLAYENQMLEAQGGRAAHVEMIPGGWISSKQIQKVNKSNVTGRVTSVTVLVPYDSMYCDPKKVGKGLMISRVLKTERLASNVYRAPTDEELVEFNEAKAKAKKERAKGPKKPSLINPTLEDAQKLQDMWNQAEIDRRKSKPSSYYYSEFVPEKVCQVTQAKYSAASKGSYARAETKELGMYGMVRQNRWNSTEHDEKAGHALCKIRVTGGDSASNYTKRVIFITDKPSKSLPAECLKKDEK